MPFPCAMLTSFQLCPMLDGPVPHVGGVIVESTCDNVIAGILPAASMLSTAICIGPPATVLDGSPTFIADFMPVAVMLSTTDHGGEVLEGLPTMLI